MTSGDSFWARQNVMEGGNRGQACRSRSKVHKSQCSEEWKDMLGWNKWAEFDEGKVLGGKRKGYERNLKMWSVWWL